MISGVGSISEDKAPIIARKIFVSKKKIGGPKRRCIKILEDATTRRKLVKIDFQTEVLGCKNPKIGGSVLVQTMTNSPKLKRRINDDDNDVR